MQSNPQLQGGGAEESSTSDGYPEDVEAEANSYFHQMFSGQLTIDAMVQMLARFKETSEDSREQSIFDCMVANFLAEYKYFPKYPEKQLKIVAVLFGSLIKHQVITHHTLGIALRGVLDALRPSSDSKMFLFGTKALEQFMDRLVEWPHYPNHILQISHLRLARADLVVFIEHALARTSSGHSEPNGAASEKVEGGGAQKSFTSHGYPEDVEAEADSYFHQIFSGQLTIDATVQMLARFKQSPAYSREQSIFDCMIGNLFAEYRYFPKYPEKQLKIAAVLFGSLIKHRLVTHLTLGIALRGVLDALRTSSDSKMLVFGTKALEQFKVRLVEWPQYSNHILQILHLRLTHADLVVFIEHALARISSGHSEPNGAATAVNHHQIRQPQKMWR